MIEPRMNPDASDAPRLTIETGAHRAASRLIPTGETRVGAAFEAEIGVSDLGMPIGFAIRRTSGGLVIRAIDHELAVGTKRLPRGQERACRTSTTLTSGPVRFRLDLPETATTQAGTRPPRWRIATGGFAAGAACAAVLTLALSLHAAPFPGFMMLPQPATDVGGSMVAAAPATTSLAKPEQSSAALLGGLRRQAAAAGIETLDLRAQPDGAIGASGTIAPFQESAWHDIGRWFDTEAHGRFVLVDAVKVANAAPVLQIQAVWPGKNPYVVDGGGQKLFVGSTVTDGWTIRSIDRSRVLIKRGEQLVSVRF